MLVTKATRLATSVKALAKKPAFKEAAAWVGLGCSLYWFARFVRRPHGSTTGHGLRWHNINRIDIDNPCGKVVLHSNNEDSVGMDMTLHGEPAPLIEENDGADNVLSIRVTRAPQTSRWNSFLDWFLRTHPGIDFTLSIPQNMVVTNHTTHALQANRLQPV